MYKDWIWKWRVHELRLIREKKIGRFWNIYMLSRSLKKTYVQNEQQRQIGTAHTDTRYNLSYSLTGANVSTLSDSRSSSTLNNTKMSVNYSLKDKETGIELTSGVVSATATSGTITSYYGQSVSGQFASERLVQLLAERVYQKLQLHFLSAEN